MLNEIEGDAQRERKIMGEKGETECNTLEKHWTNKQHPFISCQSTDGQGFISSRKAISQT